MGRYILTMKEYNDTSNFFFRRELKYMIGFIYFFFLLITLFLLWSYYFHLDIIVKARGVVRPTKNISTVMSLYEGRVANVNYYNGKSVQEGETLYSIDTFSKEINLTKNNELLKKKEEEILQLMEYESSVVSNKNNFKSKNQYYYEFKKLQLERKRREAYFREAEMEYLKNKELGFDYISEMELERFRRKYEESKYELEMISVEKIYEIESDISSLKEEVIYIKNQIKELKKSLEIGSFKSPISGVIQCNKVLNKGDYIVAESPLFNIIPLENNLKMEVQIENKDISKIKLDQLAKLRVDSLPYKEFGVSNGKVTKIAPDIREDGKYIIETTIDKQILENKSGKTENLKIGMACDIRIISTRKRVLRIILEKLNFMNE